MARNIQSAAAPPGLFTDNPGAAGAPIIIGPVPNWNFVPLGLPGLFNIVNNAGLFAAPAAPAAAGVGVVAAGNAFAWNVNPPPAPGALVVISTPGNGLVWDVPAGALPGTPITIENPGIPIPPNQQWLV